MIQEYSSSLMAREPISEEAAKFGLEIPFLPSIFWSSKETDFFLFVPRSSFLPTSFRLLLFSYLPSAFKLVLLSPSTELSESESTNNFSFSSLPFFLALGPVVGERRRLSSSSSSSA